MFEISSHQQNIEKVFKINLSLNLCKKKYYIDFFPCERVGTVDLKAAEIN